MSSIYPTFNVRKSRSGASTTAAPFAPANKPNGIVFTVATGDTFNFTTPSGVTTALFGFTPGATVLISPDEILAPTTSQEASSAHVNPAVRSIEPETEYFGYAVNDSIVSIMFYCE